jgi:hypothetical protein
MTAPDPFPGPVTYDEAGEMPLTDVLNRYQALTDREAMASAIATLKARGTYDPGGQVNDEKFPPLALAEHLELIALGERLARYFAHPAQIHHAVVAGATWEQIAAATGSTPAGVRRAYREWAEGQHRLRQDFPGGTIGLGGDEYAAALEAAGEPAADTAASDDTRRLDAIRGVLSRFDWEHDDRQLALEAIERIAEGVQA